MSKSNVLWWLILAAWMAAATWWHVCKIKLLCEPVLSEPVHYQRPDVPLTIRDGDAFSFVSDKNISFAFSDEKPDPVLAQYPLDSIATYLKTNPDRKLTIVGYYLRSESNPSKSVNLGLARAGEIKNLLLQRGTSERQISTLGENPASLPSGQDSLYQALDFTFSALEPVSAPALSTSRSNADSFEPVNFYYNSGSVEFTETPQNEKFISRARQYLVAHPEKKLLLTGHTDNTGSEAINMKFSQTRAEHLKRRLIRSGLPGSQLLTAAKGQNLPVESNNTANGRAANRRVAIVVQ